MYAPKTEFFSLFDSPEDNKKLYRELVKKHHPDKNAGNKASEETFKNIQSEYEAVKKFQSTIGVLKRTQPERQRRTPSTHVNSFGYKVRRQEPKKPLTPEEKAKIASEIMMAFVKLFNL